MIWYILAALAVLLFQALLTGTLLTKQVGSADQISTRDDLPEPSVELGRARRALANFQETLPIFLTVALLLVIKGVDGMLVHVGGLLYLAGRIAHHYCYMKALSPWRSYAYGVAMIGILLLVIALVPALV